MVFNASGALWTGPNEFPDAGPGNVPKGASPGLGPRRAWMFLCRFCFAGCGKMRCINRRADTLAWATGTHVGAGDHAIALFCIGYGCVLGFLYFDTLHFEVELHTLMNVLLYMWL